MIKRWIILAGVAAFTTGFGFLIVRNSFLNTPMTVTAISMDAEESMGWENYDWATADQQRIDAEITFALKNFVDAPEEILRLAEDITKHLPIESQRLEQIGIEALSAAYSPEAMPSTMENNDYLRHAVRYHLLGLATISRNYEVAKKLVEMGVDFRFSNNSWVRYAITKMYVGTYFSAFPDYTPGIPYLKLYLENGGDPNANDLLGRAESGSSNNLEATFILLEHGADPWNGIKYGNYTDDNYVILNINLILGNLEYLFRIANAGYFETAPADGIAEVTVELEKMLGELQDASGPERLHEKWAMEQLTLKLSETSPLELTETLRGYLATPVADENGGWILHKNQIRSPLGQHMPPDDNLSGKVIWHD